MKIEIAFKDKITERIWDQYLKRIGRMLKTLDKSLRQETLLELQGHLFEGFRDAAGEIEAERLLDAIDKMGEPEEFLKPLMADKLLKKGSRTLHPGAVVKGLFYSFFGGLWRILLTVVIGLGFLISFTMFFLALLKPIFPRHIGLLLYEDGGFILGATLNASNIRADVLGYWFVPIALVVAFLLYLVLSQLLRVLRRA